jgi:hypothetical protein
LYQPDAHTLLNIDQGRSMDYPSFYRKWEECPVPSSAETPASRVFDYYRHANDKHHGDRKHEARSVDFGDASKYYQQAYPVAHSRPNGFYYHPYSR